MDCRIWNPTITRKPIVDSYTEPSGLVYVSNSSLEYWQGRYWAAMDGTAEGLVEGSQGQQCWMTTSDDGGDTWTPAYQPFRDSDYCNNPVTDESGVAWQTPTRTNGLDWQPNLVVVGDELWSTWTGINTAFVSVLSDPDGKWTNYRFLFDGLAVTTSSTVNDAPAAGSIFAEFDGIDDWSPFCSQNPVVLSTGDVLVPLTFQSLVLSDQTDSTSIFLRVRKNNAVLIYRPATASWSVSLIDTAAFGDFVSWEPFVVENPVGDIYVYTRNLDTTAAQTDRLLVAVSTAGGETFSESASTGLAIASNRAFSRRVSDRRWVMTATDVPQGGSGYGSRFNGSVFISRRGSNDFVGGINFSDDDPAVNYPQCTVGPDDVLAINYTSGTGNGLRRSMQLILVDSLPSDEFAYIHPRFPWDESNPTAPALVSASPSYYEFTARHKIASADDIGVAAGVTYTAWCEWGYGGTIIDSRATASPRYGHVFTNGGLVFSELSMLHGVALPSGSGPVFLAAAVGASTVTLWVGDGSDTLTTETFEYRAFTVDDIPSESDTLTVDGTVYTFTATPSSGTDIEIAETITDQVFNIRSSIGVRWGQFLYSTGGITVSALMVLAAEDFSAITVTSGSSAITVEASGMPLPIGQMVVGNTSSESALTPFDGNIYQTSIYTSELSDANVLYLYNGRAAEFGFDTISGTASAPSAAALDFDAENPDEVAFPPPDTEIVGYCDVVDADTLDVYGEASAAVELPYGATEIVIRWKLGAAPTGTDQYVIATFGGSERPARLYMSGDAPTTLYLNEREVATIADPTSYQTTTVIASTDKVTVGDLSYYAGGKPRCFLGNAYPERLLDPALKITYDVSAMSVEIAD